MKNKISNENLKNINFVKKIINNWFNTNTTDKLTNNEHLIQEFSYETIQKLKNIAHVYENFELYIKEIKKLCTGEQTEKNFLNKVSNELEEIKTNQLNLIGITVSVNYSDMLELCLKHNHSFFKKWYILTEKTDKSTIELCSLYPNVEVVFFDFQKPFNNIKPTFNKGGAIRLAQEIAYKKFPHEYYLILDSDIILPENFLEFIRNYKLFPNVLFGVRRRLIPTFKEYNNFVSKINNYYPPLYNEQKGARKDILGYFQLYKSKKLYKNSETAAWCDVNFDRSFKQHRHRIQNHEMSVFHLGTTKLNWNGRVAPKFFDKNK